MNEWRAAIRGGLLSGTLAGLGMAAGVAWCGKAVTGHSLAPVNAISHMVWGNRAAKADRFSFKYTATGLMLNQVACIFWAILFERLVSHQDQNGRVGRDLEHGILISVLAYVTDYHLVPQRFSPGFELRLPSSTFPVLYSALALSLAGGVRMRKKLIGSQKT